MGRRPCAFLGTANGSSFTECSSHCAQMAECDAVLFAAGSATCVLQRCDARKGERLAAIDPAWKILSRDAARSRRCLRRAWIEPSELIAFPQFGADVEKNWNIIQAERERLIIEYHVEPHIVVEARLRRAGSIELQWMSHRYVSRWPWEVLHGVTNVRGGYCCVEVPEDVWRPHLSWRPEGDEQAPSGPLLLGVGHLQRIRTPFDQAVGDVARFRRQAKSRTYHQFFYVLRSVAPFDAVFISLEWCIAIGGHFSKAWRHVLAEGEEACESVQFVSGLAVRDADSLIVAYGINDCEADLLVVPLARVFSLLRPVKSVQNASLDDLMML